MDFSEISRAIEVAHVVAKHNALHEAFAEQAGRRRKAELVEYLIWATREPLPRMPLLSDEARAQYNTEIDAKVNKLLLQLMSKG